jgi:hypothetical protein
MKKLSFLLGFFVLLFLFSNATSKESFYNGIGSNNAYNPLRTVFIQNGTSGTLSVSIGSLSYVVAAHSSLTASFSSNSGTYTAYLSCTDHSFAVTDNLGHSVNSNSGGVATYTLNGPFSGYYEINVLAS